MIFKNSKKTLLRIKDVSIKYHTIKEETLAAKNITFDVYDKEFLTIAGPSGCGKSTVLSAIAGLIPISSGSIFFCEENQKEAAHKVGYMLQQDYLFEWRTIEQNVMLGLEIQKLLSDNSHKYVNELLEKYGLGEFKNYYPRQLSGGMRQKAALIRTLALRPDILLLDEPFSALDYQTRITLSEEVRNIIRAENKTAVLVSHDISEAVSLSDRVIIFSQRPSTVKRIIDIDFTNPDLSVWQKRKSKKFNEYFDRIWSDLNAKEGEK